MAKWEVHYEGPAKRDVDAVVRRLGVVCDGDSQGAVGVMLSGPEVRAIARELPPPEEEARRRISLAITHYGARSLEGLEPPEAGGTVPLLSLNPTEVRRLVLSDEKLSEPEEGVPLHQWDSQG